MLAVTFSSCLNHISSFFTPVYPINLHSLPYIYTFNLFFCYKTNIPTLPFQFAQRNCIKDVSIIFQHRFCLFFYQPQPRMCQSSRTESRVEGVHQLDITRRLKHAPDPNKKQEENKHEPISSPYAWQQRGVPIFLERYTVDSFEGVCLRSVKSCQMMSSRKACHRDIQYRAPPIHSLTEPR